MKRGSPAGTDALPIVIVHSGFPRSSISLLGLIDVATGSDCPTVRSVVKTLI